MDPLEAINTYLGSHVFISEVKNEPYPNELYIDSSGIITDTPDIDPTQSAVDHNPWISKSIEYLKTIGVYDATAALKYNDTISAFVLCQESPLYLQACMAPER